MNNAIQIRQDIIFGRHLNLGPTICLRGEFVDLNTKRFLLKLKSNKSEVRRYVWIESKVKGVVGGKLQVGKKSPASSRGIAYTNIGG